MPNGPAMPNYLQRRTVQVLGLYWVIWGSIGILEKRMETTTMGAVKGSGFRPKPVFVAAGRLCPKPAWLSVG